MASSLARTTFILCTFGFFKEFRPSESFVTQYLIGEHKNFTKAQVNQDIYPVGTYSNLSLLVLVFLCTDFLRYKPVIVAGAVAGVMTYSLLIWGDNIPTMQAVEFFYGLFMATEVAYYTYIYAMCDKKSYQKVSSYTRMGVLLGRFISGVVSQLTVSFQLLDYHQLNFLTLAGISFSALFAVVLPPVKGSIYFHRNDLKKTEQNNGFLEVLKKNEIYQNPQNISEEMEEIPLQRNVESLNADTSLVISHASPNDKSNKMEGLHAMWNDFTSAYSNMYILQWSLWWALATCGYLQVTGYIQMLWQVTVEEAGGDVKLYNGGLDAAYTILGALTSWVVGRQKMNLNRYSKLVLMICSLLEGTLLLVCATTHFLWVQYVLYVLFKISYHAMMILASSEVARSLTGDSHGLVFGFNMFVALSAQTVLTTVVAAKGGFRLKIRNQFLVYGSYFIILGVGFAVVEGIAQLRSRCKSSAPTSYSFTEAPPVNHISQ